MAAPEDQYSSRTTAHPREVVKSRVFVPKKHQYAGERRRYGGVVLLIVMLLAGAYAYDRYSRSVTHVRVLQGQDDEVRKMGKELGMFEASAWVADPSHQVRGMEASAVKAAVRDLRAAGAVDVLAFGSSVSDRLAVELPEDANARKQVFAWCATWEKNLRQQAVLVDSQQRYILLHTPSDAFRPQR